MYVSLKCPACGYEVSQPPRGQTCPACGGPVREYLSLGEAVVETGVALNRRRYLELRLHAFMAHLPLGFAAVLPVTALMVGVSSGSLHDLALSTARLLGMLLPLSVFLAFLLGILDARIRFLPPKSSALARKRNLSALFFFLSLLVAWMASVSPLDQAWMLVTFALLSAAAAVAGTLLAGLGAPLARSRLKDGA